jgi:hypothetical protein
VGYIRILIKIFGFYHIYIFFNFIVFYILNFEQNLRKLHWKTSPRRDRELEIGLKTTIFERHLILLPTQMSHFYFNFQNGLKDKKNYTYYFIVLAPTSSCM